MTEDERPNDNDRRIMHMILHGLVVFWCAVAVAIVVAVVQRGGGL